MLMNHTTPSSRMNITNQHPMVTRSRRSSSTGLPGRHPSSSQAPPSSSFRRLRRKETEELDREYKSPSIVIDPDNREWRTATDPRSNRIYYYNPQTRETRWDTPKDGQKVKRDAQFFQIMEANIRARLCRGDWSCEAGLVQQQQQSSSVEDIPVVRCQNAGQPPRRAKVFRTLSSIDDSVLSSYSQGYMDASPLASLKQGKTQQPKMIKRPTMEDILNQQRAMFESGHGSSTNSCMMTKPSDDESAKITRANTTSTIYVRMGTMSAPDLDATIQCVCTVLRAHIVERVEEENPDLESKYDIFRSLDVNQDTARDQDLLPSLESMTIFMRSIHFKAQMECECIIMSLIYVERLLKATAGHLVLTRENWQPILLCSMIMASKVWDDLSMWNCDFVKISPGFTLQRINTLELAYLDAVGYNVKVAASSYAKYYFHLRSMCAHLGIRGGVGDHSPLDLKGAKVLQVLSAAYEEKSKSLPQQRKRSSSTAIHSNSTSSSSQPFVTKSSGVPATFEQLVQMKVREAGGNLIQR